MTNSAFPYTGISEDVRAWMAHISTCRDAQCPVPNQHPYYPVPEQPPFFYGKRPCLPVVPARLATHKVMLIGEYPNTRFGTVTNETSGHKEEFVPVSDINEPFEGGSYYDGYNVRDYPTFTSLRDRYLTPLGLDPDTDIWLTNINKCYLMSPGNIRTYKALGWNEPKTEASLGADTDYFAVASVCIVRHLLRELELCQPKLIIAFGAKGYCMVHSSNDFKTPAPAAHFGDVAGKILLPDTQSLPGDTRDAHFLKYNVVHLFHPSYFVRGAPQADIDLHMNQHIPAVKAFIDSLGLP